MTYFLNTKRSVGDFIQLCSVEYADANVQSSEAAHNAMRTWVGKLSASQISGETWGDIESKSLTVIDGKSTNNGTKADFTFIIRNKPVSGDTDPLNTIVEMNDVGSTAFATRWSTLLTNLGLDSTKVVIVSANIIMHN